jgi:hypothetical protein
MFERAGGCLLGGWPPLNRLLGELVNRVLDSYVRYLDRPYKRGSCQTSKSVIIFAPIGGSAAVCRLDVKFWGFR